MRWGGSRHRQGKGGSPNRRKGNGAADPHHEARRHLSSASPLYDQYRQSRDKEKFLRGHESEIILFEAAARELKRLGAVPLPAAQRLRAEMDELTARRTALQSEYRKAQQKEREYDTLNQNIRILLERSEDVVLPKERSNELE